MISQAKELLENLLIYPALLGPEGESSTDIGRDTSVVGVESGLNAITDLTDAFGEE